MRPTGWLLAGVAAGLLAAAVSCSPGGSREVCGNGKDDDGNGKSDCEDPDCAGQMGCPPIDAGWYGSCAHCGGTCEYQQICLEGGWGYDTPLPECIDGHCTAYNQAVQVNMQLDTEGRWAGAPNPESIAIRVIKKKAQDGSAVSCAVTQAAAASRFPADADQLERSHRFVLQGYDVRRLNGGLGQSLPVNFINVATGGDYLVWVELWAGPPDSNTKLPTANRLGWGCFETSTAATDLSPIKPEDDCPTPNTSPTCRTIVFKMPGPQP